MKQEHTFLPQTSQMRQPLDEKRLAILVGVCVAVCRETLNRSTIEDIERMIANQTGKDGQREESIYNMKTLKNQRLHPTGIGYPGAVVQTAETQPEDQRDQTKTTSRAETPEPKLLLTVKEAAARLSIGRPKMWQLVMRGEVLSLKIGALRRISVAALEEYVQRISADAAQQSQQYQYYRNEQLHPISAVYPSYPPYASKMSGSKDSNVERREMYGKQNKNQK